MENLTAAQKEDTIVGLATLVLHDSGVEITADNINAVVKASGNSVQGFWGSIVAKTLEGKDLDEILMKPGAGGGPAVGGGAGGEAAAEEEVKEEEESEEESAGGAGGLFDDDEDDW